MNATDEELLQRALTDLADAVGISVRPTAWHVQRWIDGLPQYAVGHVERVASIRREVAALPGIAVCGAAYDGVGIAACVASGTTAATKVLGELSGGADSKS
ncbi:MAG: FAD-dependent oxidoreductase [Marmoricola sp.]